MKKFDLIIIGGGAGAFAAAIRANELGARTAMVNAGLPLGGTCVNVGCVPSKALLWAGEVAHLVRYHGIPGIELEMKSIDFRRIVHEELSLVEKLRRKKYEQVLKNLPYITAIEGRAKFVSPHDIEVNGERVSAEKFIVAVGSTASVPPIVGLREAGFLTHIGALKLERLPESLVVIGAGPQGLEFSQMFARFGTKVTLLQREHAVFPSGERELSMRLSEVLTREGISIKTGVAIQGVREADGRKQITFALGDKEENVQAEEILLAAGKIPNTQGLGLKKAGVEIDKRQAVKINQHLQTSNKNIFAVGDATNAPLRLETTAGHEGTLAAENALAGAGRSVTYHSVPYTIFTDPQLAGVGVTEAQQMNEVGVCACRTVSFSSVPKAMIMRRTEGMIKMVIHPETKRIVGVHILAPNAGEIIAQAMMLVKNKNTIDEVVDLLPVFPTLSEALKIAALSFTKNVSQLSCCI